MFYPTDTHDAVCGFGIVHRPLGRGGAVGKLDDFL